MLLFCSQRFVRFSPTIPRLHSLRRSRSSLPSQRWMQWHLGCIERSVELCGPGCSVAWRLLPQFCFVPTVDCCWLPSVSTSLGASCRGFVKEGIIGCSLLPVLSFCWWRSLRWSHGLSATFIPFTASSR